MKKSCSIVAAQLNFLVGDLDNNAKKIISAIETARDTLKADLIVFPELALSGYPPEDLLLRPGFYVHVQRALQQVMAAAVGIDVVLGLPYKTNHNELHNAAVWLRQGKIIAEYAKQCLPNYGVFDEKRYFVAGDKACVVRLQGVPIALTICEDLWFSDPARQAKAAGAQLILSLNASPFDYQKVTLRANVLKKRIEEQGLPIFYVHGVGGQDELVFDGGSFALDQHAEVCLQADFYQEGLYPLEVQMVASQSVQLVKQPLPAVLSAEARIYQALVLGVRDYVGKNHFKGAVLGLSGGIDSALTLAIAVDALGADRVAAISMPSRYTASMSIEDAKAEALALGVPCELISIETAYEAFLTSLAPLFKGLAPDVTEQNIQARCRGVLLMAISNKTGKIVLTTGNKSEISVGYSTLYGDMAGGFCVLKDVSKTWVYRLAAYRNLIQPVIPDRVLTRAPSAELADNQKDTDSLPPYDLLDPILERYVEQDQDIEEIVAAGFDRAMVQRVALMVDKNEYKRRQSPPGVKISTRAFGRDRRYPITSGYGKNILS